MTFKYEAKPIVQTKRIVRNIVKIGPPAPCGISSIVGWVLTPSGHYIREKDWDESHRLAYVSNRVVR